MPGLTFSHIVLASEDLLVIERSSTKHFGFSGETYGATGRSAIMLIAQ